LQPLLSPSASAGALELAPVTAKGDYPKTEEKDPNHIEKYRNVAA
jgi:hypothetical protein